MDETRRIVVLGKTGIGKSSLLNTILGGERVFNVFNTAVAGTKLCQSITRTVGPRKLHLIDVPGVFDPDLDPRSSGLSPEILKCNILCSPGPNAFLLVLRVEKYTRSEEGVVEAILRYFSDAALRHTLIVFTHGEDLPDTTITEWANENPSLRNLLERCGGRCFVVDNKHWNNSADPYRNNERQVEALLQAVDDMIIHNDEQYYSNDMLRRIWDFLQQEAEGLRASSPGNATIRDVLDQARQAVYNKMLNNIDGVVIGVLLGALLGAGFMVSIVASGATIATITAAGAVGAVGGGLPGAVGGAYVSHWWSQWGDSTEVQAFLNRVSQAYAHGAQHA